MLAWGVALQLQLDLKKFSHHLLVAQFLTAETAQSECCIRLTIWHLGDSLMLLEDATRKTPLAINSVWALT